MRVGSGRGVEGCWGGRGSEGCRMVIGRKKVAGKAAGVLSLGAKRPSFKRQAIVMHGF